MNKTKYAEFELSKLMLGTVQFGMNYGIANSVGQPSYETAREIISTAFEGGVNCLDTAAGYGTSEDVIGKALEDLQIKDKMTVVTKVRHMPDDLLSEREIDDIIEKSISNSLKRLRLDVLPICLFHIESNFKYIDSIMKLKKKGLVKHIGSSIMSPEGAIKILDSGLAEALQIPSSILDHRFIDKGVVDMAQNQKSAVFVRSIYLQGLLFMEEQKIPEAAVDVIPIRQNLSSLAQTLSINLNELAVRYILSIDGIASVLVGVDTIEQMKENLRLFNLPSLEQDIIQDINSIVSGISPHILNPQMWAAK